MKSIYYKGYRVLCEELEVNFHKAKVVGRHEAKYLGKGKTEVGALMDLMEQIDKVRK